MPGSGVGAGHRVVAWSKDGMTGAEFAVVDLAGGGLRAEGSAIGFEPVPYRLEYKLQAGSGLVTDSVVVVVCGDGWGRQLDLRRAGDGTWSAKAEQRGAVELAEAGGDVAALAGRWMSILACRRCSTPCQCCAAGCLTAAGRRIS